MMSGAQRDERVGIVIAAFGAKDDVVKIQKNRVPATGHDAASVVASKNCAAYRGGNVLMGARCAGHAGTIFTHVGGMRDGDMLSVAARHLENGRVDFDLL